MTPDKHKTGKKARANGYKAETAAVLFLRLKGYRILERNFKPPRGIGAGEIDIIAEKAALSPLLKSSTVQRRLTRPKPLTAMFRPDASKAPNIF